MILGLVLLAQAAGVSTPSVSSPVPARFSILVDPCARSSQDGEEIVVCAPATSTAPRLPLPDERGPPDHGVASNPDRTGLGALAVAATPCAASQWGCTVGFGPPIAPIVKAAVGLVKGALAKKPDKTGRVPILFDTAPDVATTRP